MSLRGVLDIADRGDALSPLTAALARGPAEAYASTALRPYLLAALLESARGPGDRPALIVTADDRSARDMAADLGAFLAPRRVHFYPSRGTGYLSHVAPPPHLAGLRVAAISALASGGPPIVVAGAVALAEAVPDPELRPDGLALNMGESVDLADVAALLGEAGYERVEQVEERGQFAIRGDILDAYPATEERAIRVELFGDEIESMRWFSTFTQRSLGDAQRVELAPAAELGAEHRELADLAPDPAEAQAEERPDLAELIPLDRFRSPLDLVPEQAFIAIAQPEEIPGALKDHWEDVTAAMHADDARRLYVDVADDLQGRAALSLSGTDPDQELSYRAQRAEFASRTPAEAEAELEKLVRSGYRTVVAFERAGEAERMRYNLARIDAPPLVGDAPAEPGVSFTEARLREGFIAPELKLAVVPYSRLVHRRRQAAAPAQARHRISSAIELRVGDLVVHEDHGVARFSGFDTKTLAEVTRDYLELEYRGGDRVFAPTDQLAKISRYVGADGSEAQLSALGGKRWLNLKARARRAAQEMAGGAAQPVRRATRAQRPPLLARRRVAAHLRGRVSLPRDRRPDGGDRCRQGRHGGRAPDGPPHLRRRRLRQDGGRPAGGPQGCRRRQAGDDAGPDDDPGPAALRQLPRALRRHALQRGDGLAPAQAGRGPGGAEAIQRGQGGRAARHAPPALARRPRQGPGPFDRGRGAALRRQAEGAAAPTEAEGRRAVDVGDPDPAHAADVAGRAARHLRDRDPARGAAPGANPRRPLRRRPGYAGDRARGWSAGARPSSSTTASRLCTRPPSACARSARRSGSPRRTVRWTSWSWRRRCWPSCAASTTAW